MLDDLLSEAVYVNLVETIGRLQHVQILIDLIVLGNKLVAEHTETFFPHLLHLLVNRGRPLLLVCTQECVHIVSLNVALRTLAHILIKWQWLLLKQRLSVRLLLDLHIIVLVVLEFVERVALVGFHILSLARKCATWSRSLRNIHGEYGPQVLHLPILSLAGLNAHRARKRFQRLRK